MHNLSNKNSCDRKGLSYDDSLFDFHRETTAWRETQASSWNLTALLTLWVSNFLFNEERRMRRYQDYSPTI